MFGRIPAFAWIALALSAGVPAIFLRLSGTHLGTLPDTTLFGLAIISAAFLLSWTAEAAEVDIAQGLAVAVVALIAVLPEYAVDMTFAWKAATDPEFAPFAVANMTGANRLLVGGAWPMIMLVFWWRSRRHTIALERPQAVEVVALLTATLYSFTIPLKGTINLVDTAILSGLFVVYVWIIARAPSEEPELVGPARALGRLPRSRRRPALFALFTAAAFAVFAAAEPFAEGLIHTGTSFGIDEFLLVQWVAPFASEAPEFLVAGILAYRLRAAVAMRTLLSSKVNQWTLLIGGLAVAFAAAGGGLSGIELDARQREELWLTSAQSLFAVAVLSNLTFSSRAAFALVSLFLIQFLIPTEEVHVIITFVYLAIALALFGWRWRALPRLLSNASFAARHPAEAHGEAAG